MHLPILVSAVVTSCLICTSGPDVGAARNAPSASGESPEQIVRLLAEDGKLIALPTGKGTIKHRINKDTPSFVFPTGPSRVIVFKMPEYRAPYTLIIRSNLGFGFSKSVFVPSGFFFDAEFRQSRVLLETQFTTRERGMTKGYHLEANIQVNDHNKEDRFLLLYTNDEAVGERQGTATATSASATFVAMIDLPVRRASEGIVEFETKPNK
jgi:maltose operon substrate-binding protein precursor MalM